MQIIWTDKLPNVTKLLHSIDQAGKEVGLLTLVAYRRPSSTNLLMTPTAQLTNSQHQ